MTLQGSSAQIRSRADVKYRASTGQFVDQPGTLDHSDALAQAVLSRQPADVAALAPGAGPLEVGALRPATITRATLPEP